MPVGRENTVQPVLSLRFGLQSGSAVTGSEAARLNYPPSRSNCSNAVTAARCARAGCRRYRATTIVRYVDNQGRPLRQLEVCDDHANLIIRRAQRAGAAVRDLRGQR